MIVTTGMEVAVEDIRGPDPVLALDLEALVVDTLRRDTADPQCHRVDVILVIDSILRLVNVLEYLD